MNRRSLFIGFISIIILPTFGQDYIESTSHNPLPESTARKFQYTPEGTDFVCINGNNRYTRALYGSFSPFRLETSDRPVFAAYDKKNSKHIGMALIRGSQTLPLENAAYCEARYSAGKRSYILKDETWGRGELHITALAFPDEDGAIWQITTKNMPTEARLNCFVSEIKQPKLYRNGDLGVDPPDCFDAPQNPKQRKDFSLSLENGIGYFYILNQEGFAPDNQKGKQLYEKALQAAQSLAERIIVDTPDPYLNTLGGTLSAAADGIWDGEVWLHGAIGWRMPLNGWRAAYTGDCLGLHDRARIHFNAYADSQVDSIPPQISHPAQDEKLHLARARKEWGTPMYSNGYICRNPHRKNQMNHYDMNLVYIDELLWHLNWTGDTAYARKMWPVITRHLDWEKRNYDPDNDGLYDAYCCIWASDALYYNSGAVTHSSAYNYRANKLAAEIAKFIGENGESYQKEADKILHAINHELWMPKYGVWAEFKDFMGEKRLHTHPAVWTIYHAIDSDIATSRQAYSATQYIDKNIPQIPVLAQGLKGDFSVVSTTDWMPYAWSINNVAFAEIMHTALAYWQAGRTEKATTLFKSCILDGMYLGKSPGNIGQISYYDAARGECYRDFGDPVGITSRALVQGLFGILPDAMHQQMEIRPGFPTEWNHASLRTPDIDIQFRREGDEETYKIACNIPAIKKLTLHIPAWKNAVSSIKINGKETEWAVDSNSVGCPRIYIHTPTFAGKTTFVIQWKGKEFQANNSNNNTQYSRIHQGLFTWWQPADYPSPYQIEKKGLNLQIDASEHYEPIDLNPYFNAQVTDIFRNQYLSPHSPYTTLQMPWQGIGEWCHPLECDTINDAALRKFGEKAFFDLSTKQGKVRFQTPANGKNIVYTTLWNNYPNMVTIPLKGRANGINLLMAGSTNHMQCYMENARFTVTYQDGTQEVLPLIPPFNWCPIEQDYFIDGKAFRLPTERPYRFCLQSGIVSNDLENALSISKNEVYGRKIKGGAGILLGMPLNKNKELKSLELRTISNDVVAGLISATLVK